MANIGLPNRQVSDGAKTFVYTKKMVGLILLGNEERIPSFVSLKKRYFCFELLIIT